jgi:hypothetical protein
MIFVRTFKGYEDKTAALDEAANEWISQNAVDVVDIKVVLSHEPGGRASTGDLLFAVLYRADAPIP